MTEIREMNNGELSEFIDESVQMANRIGAKELLIPAPVLELMCERLAGGCDNSDDLQDRLNYAHAQIERVTNAANSEIDKWKRLIISRNTEISRLEDDMREVAAITKRMLV